MEDRNEQEWRLSVIVTIIRLCVLAMTTTCKQDLTNTTPYAKEKQVNQQRIFKQDI